MRHQVRVFLGGLLLILAVLMLATACGVGTTPTGAGVSQALAQSATPAATSTTTTSNQSSTGLIAAIEQVTNQVKPAVVQVTTTISNPNLGPNHPPVQQAKGVGSGVIYDPSGYILTNAHVVEGAQSVTVSIPGQSKSYTGKVVGTDTRTDLAVVKIDGQNLPVAKLGSSSSLKVGQWVVAIGNALALPGGPTVTQGVVSALNRTVQEPPNSQTGQAGPYLYDLVQTDAAINPGNSGGPLVDLNGDVVGINTLAAGTTPSGTPVQGIGFAISIDSAKQIAQQLQQTGHVNHPYIGIEITDLNPATASQLGINQTQGIVIMQVVSGSPAAKAGLQAKDVITQVDGQKVTSASDLGRILLKKKPGDQLTMTILRNGQTQQVTVTLGQTPQGGA